MWIVGLGRSCKECFAQINDWCFTVAHTISSRHVKHSYQVTWKCCVTSLRKASTDEAPRKCCRRFSTTFVRGDPRKKALAPESKLITRLTFSNPHKCCHCMIHRLGMTEPTQKLQIASLRKQPSFFAPDPSETPLGSGANSQASK